MYFYSFRNLHLLGYLNDPFIKYFYPKSPQRKPPLINRGYFARVYTFQKLISNFCEIHDRVQIVSLGAGYDTTFWKLQKSSTSMKYIEIDFKNIVQKKSFIIQSRHELNKILKNPKISKGNSKKKNVKNVRR